MGRYKLPSSTGRSPDLWFSALPAAFPDILQWRTLQVAPTYSGRTVQDFHLVPSYPLRWAKELELKDIYLYYSISTPVPEFLLSFFLL